MAARSDKTAAHISPLSSAPSGESSRGARRRWAITASGLIIVLAGAAVYHNSLNGPFIFDDINSIPGSPTIRSLWPIWPALSPQTAGGLAVQDRPIVNLSLAVNYAIGELDVRGYHIFNLVVHLLAALTLFGVIRRTLQLAVMPEHVVLSSLPLAFVAALIWTVHPLNTEAVTYIIQRTESLMALFYLLTLYCVIRAAAAPGPLPWYLAAVVACALGAGCKEAMVTAPVIILLYDRVFLSRSFKEVFARRWPLYVGLAATWGLLAALVLPLSGRAELPPEYEYWTATRSYAYMQFEAVVRYLGLCFWPYTLVMDYGELSVGEVALSVPQAIVIGLLLAGTIWGLCRRPRVGFLGVWFFGILAPSSSVIPLVLQQAAEKRMYLPLAAVVLGVVISAYVLGRRLLDRLGLVQGRRKVVGRLVALAVALALGVVTVRRNCDYRSEMSIWDDTITKKPDNARAWINRGNAFASMGRYDQAIRDLDRAIEIKPDSSEAHSNRGAAYASKRNADKAIGDLDKAIKLKPDYAKAYNNRAVAHFLRGDYGASWADVRKCQDLGGRVNPDFLANLIRASRGQ